MGSYQSLVLLAVPTSLIEPLKFVAAAIAAEGHWGTTMIIAAYAGSLFVVKRLFRIVKPKLDVFYRPLSFQSLPTAVEIEIGGTEIVELYGGLGR